jgi:uncharacterized protein (DUF1330 family)
MTIDDIKAANKAAGGHWFDADTLRFFRSQVTPTVYEGPGGVFFVTSEQYASMEGPLHPRRYSLRQFHPETGSVDTVGDFQQYRTSLAARQAARKAAAAAEPTWDNQIKHARTMHSDELQRHASVSTSNRHRCEDCFCCAALTVLEERKAAE